MAGKIFGREFNLAVWQIMNTCTAKLNSANILSCCHCNLLCAWAGSHSDAVVCKELPNCLEVNQLNSAVFQ